MLQPTLVAETLTPIAGGKVQIAIRMTPKGGWYGYWLNSGSPSLKDKFEWDVPKGFTISALQYPLPLKKSLLGVTSHVYSGEYALLAELQTPKDFIAPATIALRASYLTCSETVCLPQKTSVGLTLTPGKAPVLNTNMAQFDEWRSRLPQSAIKAKAFAVDPDTVRIELPWDAPVRPEKAWFFADDAKQIDASADQDFNIKDGVLSVAAKRKPNSDFQYVGGVVDFGTGRSAAIFATIIEPNHMRAWMGWLAGLFFIVALGSVLIFCSRLRRSSP